MAKQRRSIPVPENFNKILPQTITASASHEEHLDKTAQTFTGFNSAFPPTMNAGVFLNSPGVMRGPSRRFYHPELTTSAIYLPKSIKEKNRWRRWFFDHDELVGAVLEVHAELPYSKAELRLPDKGVLRVIEDCIDATKLFSTLPMISLEFLKIGSVCTNLIWNSDLGYWTHIVILNPDYLEVKYTPYVDEEYAIEIVPDEELKKLVHSSRPEDQPLKKKLPPEILKRVLTGRNIPTKPDEVCFLARRSSPYDIYGTSIIDRLFRLLMYEDKLREAQITIADNFIYPLKVFKLGDPSKGWIPDSSHMRALAQMLMQSTFDPNFSLIYHYGLSVEFHTVADKIMRLDSEWDKITERKMIALGVSKQFLEGTSTYASANVGLQTQLARYKAHRDMIEEYFIKHKFLKGLAQRNEWYYRDKREIVANFRVKRSAEEQQKRLMIPELIWHKKLVMRDDQAYLSFLNNVYGQGKGPVSAISLLLSMGMNLEEELRNKRIEKELEEKYGAFIKPPVKAYSFFDKIKLGSKKDSRKEESVENTYEEINDPDRLVFVASSPDESILSAPSEADIVKAKLEQELEPELVENKIQDEQWKIAIQSSLVPFEVRTKLSDAFLLIRTNTKNLLEENDLVNITSFYNPFVSTMLDLYRLGKFFTYEQTSCLPIYHEYYRDNVYADYADLLIQEEFERWLKKIAQAPQTLLLQKLKEVAASAFVYGQLNGYREQGIENVKVGNSLISDGTVFSCSDLLKKDYNLNSLLSPKGGVIILYPCITGYENSGINTKALPDSFEKTKNIVINNISVENIPVEYITRFRNIVEKLYTFFKPYRKIIFVDDIVNVSDWQQETISTILDQTFSEQESLNQSLLPSSYTALLEVEKHKKIGTIPFYATNSTLYLPYWLGLKPISLTESILSSGIVNVEKIASKLKDEGILDFNLTAEELQTYVDLGYLTYYDELDIYQCNHIALDAKLSNHKLFTGTIWNKNGVCLSKVIANDLDLCSYYLKLYVDYPHLLPKRVITSLSEV